MSKLREESGASKDRTKPTKKANRKATRRAKGEGSIRYDEKHERWVGSFQTKFGDRRYVAGTKGESQKSFLKKFNQAKAQAAGVRPTKDTFGSFLCESWLPCVRSNPDIRPRTYDSYKETVEKYLLPVLADIRLVDLTREDIRRAMNRAANMGRAVRTVHYVRTVARIALGVAVADELLDKNVAALLKPEKSRVQKMRSSINPYIAEEIVAITAKADEVFNGLLVVIGAFLGLRRGELCGLQWQDFDEANGRLAVHRQVLRYERKLHVDELKTANSHRLLTLPPSLIERLKRHRRAQLERRMRMGSHWSDEGFIFAARFGGPLDPRNAQRLYDRILTLAEVQKKSLHTLRHTVATLQLQSGTTARVVAEILGHSSTRVTNDVYAHVTPVMMADAAAKMEKLLTGGSK